MIFLAYEKYLHIFKEINCMIQISIFLYGQILVQ